MRAIRRLRNAWRARLRRDQLDRDLDAELSAAVDELAARYVERGLPMDAARRAARVELGGVEQVKEQVRDVRTAQWLDTAVREIRLAWRMFWRTPVFAVTAILTLAIGIGATTAIFTVVNAMLIEPLPYRAADRLVFVWADLTEAGYPRAPLAGPELQDLRERATRFEGFGGIWANTAAITGDGDPEQLRIGLVTSNFFDVLGAAPALGRTFTPSDEVRSASPGIVLSAAVWQRRYGSDPSIVGRRILVNNRPTTVLGVMPEAFRLLLPPDSAVPDDLQAWQLLNASFTTWPRTQQFLRVVGRMKPGVPLHAAQHEVAAIGQQVGREFSGYGPAGATFYAVGLQDDGMRELRPALLALFAGVVILLAIASVNVAGLLIARTAARAKETAMRMALGAGRGRLIRQCLIDGLLLVSLGGAAGLLLGRAVLAMLMSIKPPELQRIEAAALDGRVFAFVAGISVFWGLLLSLGPVTELFRTDPASVLQGGRRAGCGHLRYRTRAWLVGAQLALSVVLLVSAALLLRGFQRLLAVDPGFHPEGVITFKVALPGPRYNTREKANEFSRQLRTALAALPGVTAAGGISHLPYDNLPNWGGPYLPEFATDEREAGLADSRAVTPGYFETVGARLLEGRFFAETDSPSSVPVAIVDTQLAGRLWPGQSAIGRRMKADPFTSGSPGVTVTIVGVIQHVRHRQLTRDVREQVYFPLAQAPRNPVAYAVRTRADAATLTPAIRRALAGIDPALPMFDARGLDAFLDSARAARRFTIQLAAAFALVALVLACIGVYGVAAYAVTLRRQEFGVRIALGARRAQIVRLVLREGSGIVLGGAIAGLAGAVVAGSLLRAQLFEIAAVDPASYAAGVIVVAVAVAAASWIPARRAATMSPFRALNEQ
jgi:putative ABC transport system permease protein